MKAQIVRCAEHGEGDCFQQHNGKHISKTMCTCDTKPPYLCRIDAHATKYLLENPEWLEEAPARHAPANKPTPQDCGHRGDKRLTELPGQIRSWLCKACRKELDDRLGEVKRPATPIELYSKRGRGTKMADAAGCGYQVGKDKKQKDRPVLCGLVCEVGKTMCPRHEMLWPIEQAEKRKKEDAKLGAAKEKREQKTGAAAR